MRDLGEGRMFPGGTSPLRTQMHLIHYAELTPCLSLDSMPAQVLPLIRMRIRINLETKLRTHRLIPFGFFQFHLKEEMSVAFISNWIELNLPRVLIMTHKYVTHQLTTGWAQAQAQVSPPTPDHHLQAPAEDLSLPQTPAGDPFPDDSCLNDSKAQDARAPDEAESGIVPFQIGPIRKRVGVTGIHPVLLWLLGVSLPPPYAGPLERKPEGLHCPFTKFISPQQFLRQVVSETKSSNSRRNSWNSFRFPRCCEL